MKRFIRWSLNHIPRKHIQRIAGWAIPVVGLFYKGRGVECSICGSKYRKFMPYGYVTSRENALCPSCLSLERHRLLWLYLTRETDILSTESKIIHIAPEVCIMKRFKKLFKQNSDKYITADLESPLADIHFDVLDIPLDNESTDIIICNHIMEHLSSDFTALKELYRIMKPGGWGVILSPVELDREATFEDDSIIDPAERTRIFGQYDHRRIYGQDYAQRLASVGFEVEDIDYKNTLPPEIAKLHALPDDHIYIVRKCKIKHSQTPRRKT